MLAGLLAYFISNLAKVQNHRKVILKIHSCGSAPELHGIPIFIPILLTANRDTNINDEKEQTKDFPHLRDVENLYANYAFVASAFGRYFIAISYAPNITPT
jgi:hypothetical protein